LPPPPPLRTARAPFDACSSSIGQRTYHSTRLPALTLRATCTLLRESRPRNRREPHQQGLCAPPTSALPPQVGWPTVHVRQHQREVSRLSPWGKHPCPIHYRPAFASSLLLYPQPHRRALRFAFPGGEATGLPRSADVPGWVRSYLSAGGASSASGEFGAPELDHVPFGSSVPAACARHYLRRLTILHLG
jgi:hypothetical protein